MIDSEVKFFVGPMSKNVVDSIIETNNFIQFDLTNQYFVNSL